MAGKVYENYLKRWIDLVCGLGVLICFWWLYLIIALLVKFKLGSPVLFVQDRPGKNEKVFKMYKFRTMTEQRDEFGELLPDEQRLTKFGSFLRSTSLDELPEIFNIVKGDMSIVGPRPLLVRYLPYYTPNERRRHDVRPGLTGYAQVRGRNYVTWEDKFKYDLWYVDNISLMTDLKILYDTIRIVVKRENIETASSIVHDGVVYQPLDIERRNQNVKK